MRNVRSMALIAAASAALPSAYGQFYFCKGQSAQSPCAGKNPRVQNVQVIQQSGARARFSPDGQSLVFDQVTPSTGYSNVFLMKPDGSVSANLTQDKAGITQRNNGNAVFDPSGQFIIFVSEAPQHPDFGGLFANSGIGVYSNLWATDLTGSKFWQLTNIPIQIAPVIATVNPLFSYDGKMLVWTERFANAGSGLVKWGWWRIKAMDFSIQNGQPVASNERVLFTAPDTNSSSGNYVTAMGFQSPTLMLVAGNLDGQNVFGMDEYLVDITNHSVVRNLTNTPNFWEEGSSVAPNDFMVYMSNKDSQYQFNFNDPNWALQPITREYFLVDPQNKYSERLTYFNDPSAPEYTGTLVAPVAMDVSPDGLKIVATLAVATSSSAPRDLKIAMISLSQPLHLTTVSSANYSTTVAPESIASAFGSDVATGQALPENLTPPESLGGTSVTVTDSTGTTRKAGLYFVTPGQVNYQIPAGTANGTATITITNSTGAQVRGTVQVASAAPALYTANASGSGAPAALTYTQAGYGIAFTCSGGAGSCAPAPINLSGPNDVYLILYGTGIRGAGSSVTVKIGDQTLTGAVAAQGQYAGLDQINVLLPRSLAGAGLVNVVVTAGGQQSNTVQVQIQ